MLETKSLARSHGGIQGVYTHQRQACAKAGIPPLTLNMREGYDHSYYFISTFMAEHIAWHAGRLKE